MKELYGTDSVKLGYTFGLLFTLILGIGSIFFYRERMLFVDPAFITFEIINSGWFVFGEHRYGAWITQIFPLVGSRLGLSIKSILVLYSMSFYLFYLTIIYVSGHILKQYKYALLFCFYLTLMVSDVYFWPNNEIHQAVAWMTLFVSLWSWMVSKPRRTPLWMHGLIIVSLFFAIISHLLIFIPLGFLWIYSNIDFFRIDKKIDKKTILYGFLILIGIGIRYWMSSDSWYDGNKLNGVQNISLNSIVDAATNAQGKSFIHLLFTRYWSVLIVAALGFIQLISTKQFLKLGLVFFTSTVFYLLVTLTYSDTISVGNLFYFESQWMGLSILLATPFVMDFLPRLNKNFTLAIMSLLIICQVPKLFQSYEKFNNRLVSLTSLTANANQQSITKGYISESKLHQDTFLMTWGLPIETLLLSQIDDRFETLTIKNFGEKSQITEATDSLYTAFKFVGTRELNQKYFIMDEGKYEKVIMKKK